MTKIGMYGYQVKPFRKYLKDTSNITFAFAMPAGHNDAWSSTAVELGNKTNAVNMVNSNGCNASRIKSFPYEMQDSIYTILEKWLGIDLSNNNYKKGEPVGIKNLFPIL